MSKLRTLSGKDVILVCEKLGFNLGRQRGSHVNLVRVTENGRQVITIPNHKELAKGTLHGIFKQLLRFVPEEDLRVFFYSE